MDTPIPPAEHSQSEMVKGRSADARNGNGHTKPSAQQHEANRRNALRSTGPRTAAGKERVHWNAVKHGLLAQEVLLPGDDGKAFEDLARRMHTEAQPVGAEEDALVERMTVCLWRLRRLARVENGILTSEYLGILAERASREARRYERSRIDEDTKAFDQAHNPTTITDPAKHQLAITTRKDIACRAEADTPTLGQAFVRAVTGVDALSKLSRYETSIERSYYRALHELERRQRARQGEPVPPPLALEVNVTGEAEGSA